MIESYIPWYIAKPASARAMAGPSTVASGSVPLSATSRAAAATTPGVPTGDGCQVLACIRYLKVI